MALDEAKDKTDISMKINNINILIDKEVEYLMTTGNPLTIDYHKSSYNEGFTIDNGTFC